MTDRNRVATSPPLRSDGYRAIDRERVQAFGHPRSQERHQKRFSIFRFKRHDPPRLAGTLSQLGWELLSRKPLSGPRLRLFTR